MKFIVAPSRIDGEIAVPASKSHTIRALFFAALAHGVSTIVNPLDSADARAARSAVEAMSARVKVEPGIWTVEGFGGRPEPREHRIDIGNSGTSARFLISMGALSERFVTVVGDESTSRRPMSPLIDALNELGADGRYADGGTLPVTIKGPARGARVRVDGMTSQYLSSLLIHAPLFERPSRFDLDRLNEKPYVDMTLSWLDRLGARYERVGYSSFMTEGGARYRAFEREIPGDFSSATFFAALGAIPGNRIRLRALDISDPQGDKAIFGYLEKMGAKIRYCADGAIEVEGGDSLRGARLDLNATPDALCAFAALATQARGKVELVNVPQARIKETDRIDVMARELTKMGAKIETRPDGMTIYQSKLKGGELDGHHDHRVVMSLAVAASVATGESSIDTAESVDVTFPQFESLFAQVGGEIELLS